MEEFRTHRKYYWVSLLLLVIAIFLLDIFVIKSRKYFSFEFYFLMTIPVWIGTLSMNGVETNRIKDYLRKYLNYKYPDKLKAFDETPVDILNSESEEILDLLKDEDLKNDNIITRLRKESTDITKFMYAVFFALPIMLISTFFFILSK